jgi:hypothetical protein
MRFFRRGLKIKYQRRRLRITRAEMAIPTVIPAMTPELRLWPSLAFVGTLVEVIESTVVASSDTVEILTGLLTGPASVIVTMTAEGGVLG